ncbi:MAG: ComF family protein [Lachnospiraceae bacterium]
MNAFKNLIKYLKKFYTAVIKLLFPDVCVFCGNIESNGICETCRKSILYISEPRCKRCGKPIRYEEQEYCSDCKKTDFAYEQGRSLWLHKGEVSKSIYMFKYKNRRTYAEVYAREMAKQFSVLIKEWGIQTIIPIPLHRKRRQARGYNQAEILADYLSTQVGIPVEKKTVFREKYTQPQKVLNDKERRKNLQGAFTVADDWNIKQKILLIDDIYTTGSTVNAVAKVLKERGAKEVFFLSISIGQGE